MAGQPGRPLRRQEIAGEDYLRATDLIGMLKELSVRWHVLADAVDPDADPRQVAHALADLLSSQAEELDFSLIAARLAS